MRYLPLFSSLVPIKNPKQDGFTSIKCPFHNNGQEKDSSAGIDLNKGVFSCRACGRNYSAAKFISELNQISITEAGTIVDSYRIENNIKVEINGFSKKFVLPYDNQEWKDLYFLSKKCNLKETFATDYCKERGFNIETLEREGVGFLPAAAIDQWKRDSLVFPYFYGGKLVGLQFRDEENSKTVLEGSINVPWGINTISPFTKKVVIVEGASDRLKTLFEFHQRQIDECVISTPGAFFKDEWERDFIGMESIVTVSQSDRTGKSLHKEFKERYGQVVKDVKLPWKRQQMGKDVCDWCGVEENNVTELIEEIVRSLNVRSSNNYALSTSDFLDDKTEDTEEIIANFLYQGQIFIIGGPQKGRKTMFALNLVRCVLNPGETLWGIEGLTSATKMPNVLYIQTEGSKQKFQERIAKLSPFINNGNKVFWWFKPGIKLDDPKGVERLEQKIKELEIGLVILDPFQRLHTKNEDNSTETGIVWDAIFSIMLKFPTLATIILHHFGKDKNILQRWEALRGSGRMAGEVDGAFFVENRMSGTKVTGSRGLFEFRDEESLLNGEGKEVFEFVMTPDLIISEDTEKRVSMAERITMLELEVKERKKWKKLDAIEFFGCTLPTMDNWLKKSTNITSTKASSGNPVLLVWTGDADG